MTINRRNWRRRGVTGSVLLLVVALTLLTAQCGQRVAPTPVVVQATVIVEQTVVVERTVVVEQTVEVEKVVMATPAPPTATPIPSTPTAISVPLTPTATPDIELLGGDPAKGEALFFDSKQCYRCHAINGRGGLLGPDLGEMKHDHTNLDMVADMWNHSPRMTAVMRDAGVARPTFQPGEMADLIAFLHYVAEVGPDPQVPGDPEVGRELFVAKQCVHCHQWKGLGGHEESEEAHGGLMAPDLGELDMSGMSAVFMAADMWNHSPIMTPLMDEEGLPRPTFDEGELADLVAFLHSDLTLEGIDLGEHEHEEHGHEEGEPSDQEAAGADLFATNCVLCHGGKGEGLSGLGKPLNTEGFQHKYTDEEIIEIIEQGRPGTAMPAWEEKLSHEEIEALVVFIRTLSGHQH